MSQLKPSFVREVREALANSKFTAEDFDLELPSGRVLLKISFLYKPEYYLALLEEEKSEAVITELGYLTGGKRTERVKQVVYSVRMVPGRFKVESIAEVSNPGDVLSEIPRWCENVRADLYALAPSHDPLDQLRQKLNENLDGLVQEPNSFFTEEELKVVDVRFDRLYEEISNLREQYSLTKQQLSDLLNEFEEFKSSARAYPKGIWAKVTGNKLVKATGKMFNTPEGRTFLFQQARRVLGMADDA